MGEAATDDVDAIGRGGAGYGPGGVRLQAVPTTVERRVATGGERSALYAAQGEPELEISAEGDLITSQIPADMDIIGGSVVNLQGTAILGRVIDSDVVCCDGTLFVAAGASVSSASEVKRIVHGKRVVVAGTVDVDTVRADELMLIVPGGRVTAREITYGRLSIRTGAFVNATGGFRQMRPNEDPSAEDEHRRIVGARTAG